MPKLTLNIDERAIEVGKDYARRQRTSLSRLVADFLRSLSGRKDPGDPVVRELHEELIAGGFRPVRAPDDELRRRHVRRKHLPAQ